MTTINTALAGFFSSNEANVNAINKLLAAVKAARIRTAKALRPLAMQAASKYYGVAIVEMDNGKPKLDSDAKSYEAARKAMSRAIAKCFPPAKNASTDPVGTLVKRFEKMDKAAQKRFLKAIGA